MYVISDLNGEEILGTFYENELRKTNQTKFKTEKIIKRKCVKLISNGKVTLILLTVGLIQKTSLYKMSYFPEPCTHKINKILNELDLPNYATNSNLKNARGIDTSKFDKQADSASLKTEIRYL